MGTLSPEIWDIYGESLKWEDSGEMLRICKKSHETQVFTGMNQIHPFDITVLTLWKLNVGFQSILQTVPNNWQVCWELSKPSACSPVLPSPCALMKACVVRYVAETGSVTTIMYKSVSKKR